MLTVSRLFIYPIKSCAGVEVSSLSFDQCGPVGDRRFMVVNLEGRFLTQRTHPAMAFIRPQYVDGHLLVSASDRPQLTISPEDAGEVLTVSVWDDSVAGADCGDTAAAWFSAALNTPCRLVRVFAGTERQVNRKYAQEGEWVGFADGYPVLVTLQESLDVLSSAVGRTVEIERFRPNVLLSGARAFAEREWQSVSVAGGRLDLCKPCERCVIPTRNLTTQQREADVLDALKQHCRLDGKIIFGQNALVRGIGELVVGQSAVSE
ncbi:MOSC domain-containing protein [Thalassolituus sp. LLYu03]|uniref:MOSC domain-containing protein n=1 Tax=Thalassolituus sp. LLYu03 TaxID=3421656 RepID=UPI003D276A81